MLKSKRKEVKNGRIEQSYPKPRKRKRNSKTDGKPKNKTRYLDLLQDWTPTDLDIQLNRGKRQRLGNLEISLEGKTLKAICLFCKKELIAESDLPSFLSKELSLFYEKHKNCKGEST